MQHQEKLRSFMKTELLQSLGKKRNEFLHGERRIFSFAFVFFVFFLFVFFFFGFFQQLQLKFLSFVCLFAAKHRNFNFE